MKRILEWNYDDPKCWVCGDKDFEKVMMTLKDREQTSLVCQKCRGVYMVETEYVGFMGFLPKDIYFKLLTMDEPMIKATAEDHEIFEHPQDPQLN